MTKKIEKLYNLYDRESTSNSLTEKAEDRFSEIYKRIEVLNSALAFELDGVIGELARAYEKQGFEAGYNAAARQGRTPPLAN